MDLFESRSTLNPLPIVGGSLFFGQSIPLTYSTDEILKRLISETHWRTETIRIWGKTYLQPRLLAWYGDAGKSYTYSNKQFTPLEWTPLLLCLKNDIERVCETKFNSVLLNYYRNGLDSMGFHSDNEPELGDFPSIASLSLGETRTLIFKHKTDKYLKPLKINLEDGNLILMEGEIQKNWKHGILKEPKKTGGRVNLTFRSIIK